MLELVSAPVSHLDLRPMVMLGEDVSVREAVRELRERRRGSVVVAGGDGSIVGIFTERDVLLASDRAGWLDLPLSRVMSPEPARVRLDQPINDALQIMKRGGFRHLPVVDSAGRPAGVVSIRDVLRYIIEQFPDHFLSLPPDPSLEASKPWGG